MELFDILANQAFWVVVLRIATPLILGTLGVLLFAFFDALQLRLQQFGAAVLPLQMYLMPSCASVPI
jgi:ABC-type uncharacterized transport system permease subunit